jgi:hypothetical protein
VDNLKTWTEWDQWQGEAGTNYIYITQADNSSCDYIGIAAHNLGDEAGVQVTLEYYDDAAMSWTNAVTFSPFDSKTLYRIFTSPGSYQQWRVTIVTTSLVPAIGVLAIGEYTELENGMTSGFKPPLVEGFKEYTSISEGGSFLGRSIIDDGELLNIDIKNLSPLWVRMTYVPFLEHAKEKPFFFTWDKDNYLSETAFCWTERAINSPKYQDSVYMSHSLPVKGKGASNALQPILDLPLESSLDLKAGSGSVTFTRASSATYVKDGVILTAAIDEPRFEANGLLIEGESENGQIYSEDFSNAAWGKIGCTVTSNNDTAPDGSTTMDRIVESANIATHEITEIYQPAIGPFTASCYAKPSDQGSKRWLAIILPNVWFNDAIYRQAVFDLELGTITNESGTQTATIEEFSFNGESFYRCSISTDVEISSANTYRFRIKADSGSGLALPSYQGDGLSGFHIWGAQLEEQPAATSYIPTAGAAVTRSQDVCYIPPIGNIPNTETTDPAITVSCKFDRNFKSGGTQIALGQRGASNSNQWYLGITSTGYPANSTEASGVPTTTAGPTESPLNTLETFTAVWGGTVHTLYVGGVQVDQETRNSALVTNDLTSYNIVIGNLLTSSSVFSIYGHVSSIKIFNKALSADEEAAL